MTVSDGARYGEQDDGEQSPRPILVNLWYPAQQAEHDVPMRRRGYFDYSVSDPRLERLAAALAQYQLEVIAQEIFGKSVGELNELETLLRDRYLDAPTVCRRDATPVPGTFPLILYHAGYGSSLEDNATLCELLASCGYVVLGSAFQEPSGTSFNVDGKTASSRDFEFLINWASRLPFVDGVSIGVIGHSGGAHAALMFRAQEKSAVDAVVSLDSTQDYYSLADPRWDNLTTTVLAGRQYFDGPLLVVANPHAFFSMCEQLEKSPRYYLTLKSLDHNDFISQGCDRQDCQVQLLAALRSNTDVVEPSESEVKARSRLQDIRRDYGLLNQYIVQFLDAHIKRDDAARQWLLQAYRDTRLGGAEPHVEFVAVGQQLPPKYTMGEAALPSPRQLRPCLDKHGVEATLTLLRHVRREDPGNPVMHGVFTFALIYELYDQGCHEEARLIAEFAREAQPDFSHQFVENGRVYARFGRHKFARRCLEIARFLDPDDIEAAEILRQFDAKELQGGEFDNHP